MLEQHIFSPELLILPSMAMSPLSYFNLTNKIYFTDNKSQLDERSKQLHRFTLVISLLKPASYSPTTHESVTKQ